MFYMTLTNWVLYCFVHGLMDSDLILCFSTSTFVIWLTWDWKMSNPFKSILVAIAATLLIVVLTWSVRQVKSHKTPTTETGTAANNEISLLWQGSLCCTLCVTAWGTEGALLFLTLRSGHETKYAVRYWQSHQAILKQECILYHAFALSGRVGASEWACQSRVWFAKAVPTNCSYNRKKAAWHSWIF